MIEVFSAQSVTPEDILLQTDPPLGSHMFSVDLGRFWTEALERLPNSSDFKAALGELATEPDAGASLNVAAVVRQDRDAILAGVVTEQLGAIAIRVQDALRSSPRSNHFRTRVRDLAAKVEEYREINSYTRDIISRYEAEPGPSLAVLQLLADKLSGVPDVPDFRPLGTPAHKSFIVTTWRRIGRRTKVTPQHSKAGPDHHGALYLNALAKIDRAKRELGQACQSVRTELLSELTEVARQDDKFAGLLLEWQAARSELLTELQDAMLGSVRTEIARRLGANYELTVDFLPVGALVRTGGAQRIPFATEAYARLDRIIALRDRASIGLSGPRGAGKSTLIRHMCFLGTSETSAQRDEWDEPSLDEVARAENGGEEKPRLGLILSAPTRYEPKEFILHVHEQVCRAILGRHESGAPVRESPSGGAWPTSSSLWLGLVVACGLAFAGLSLALYTAMNGPALTSMAQVGWALLLMAAAFSVLGAYMTYRRSRPTAADMGRPPRPAYVKRVPYRRWQHAVADMGRPPRPAYRDRKSPWNKRLWSAVLPWCISSSALGIGIVLLISSAGFMTTLPLVLAPSFVVIAAFMARGADVLTLFTGEEDERYFVRRVAPLQEVARFSELSRDHAMLVPLAREHLRELRYSTSYTAESSATMKAGSTSSIPLGVEAKRGRGISIQPSSVTYPEIVERLRRLLHTVGGEYDVVIGIDELDKMRSAEDVESFLNEVKSIFDVRGCYYLVSVSEDAAAGFERRGVAFRDVFDSSFDDVLNLPFLTFDESRELLYAAAGRWTTPLVMICHVLAGGLPRDLLRWARQVIAFEENRVDPPVLLQPGREIPYSQAELVRTRRVDERDPSRRLDVAEVARELVRQDIQNRCRAVQHEIRKMISSAAAKKLYPHVPNWTSRSVEPSSLRTETERLRAVLATETTSGDETVDAGDQQIGLLARELAAAHLFGAVLLEFFEGYSVQRMKEIERSTVYSQSIDGLADARRNFGLDPDLALVQLQEFSRPRDELSL
jgi:hypothetical protein